jgi:Ax21 family sulfation-dependent quorum factor
MIKHSLIALALAALLPLSAQADDKLSYTYVEGHYVDVDGDADGFGVRGSFEFGQSNFYGFGAYQNVEFDNTSIDVDLWDLGIGYAHGISPNAALISELAYIKADAGSGADADGYRVSVGLRGSFSDSFEGLLKANYTDGSDFDSDFSATAGLQWKFTQTWGVVGEATFGDNADSYLIGLRASF